MKYKLNRNINNVKYDGLIQKTAINFTLQVNDHYAPPLHISKYES